MLKDPDGIIKDMARMILRDGSVSKAWETCNRIPIDEIGQLVASACRLAEKDDLDGNYIQGVKTAITHIILPILKDRADGLMRYKNSKLKSE